MTQTFDKQRDAKAWASDTEAAMRAGTFNTVESNAESLSNFTIDDLFDAYQERLSVKKKFGRSKAGAIEMIRAHMPGKLHLDMLDVSAIMKYAKKRAEGKTKAGGVTISIELTYLAHALKVAPTLLKIPFKTNPVDEARPMLKFLDLVSKSRERDRRPTEAEIIALCTYFNGRERQRIPMGDIIMFAVATTMRASEITSLRWNDLNEHDRTILIRDRKHPQEKIGNNQTVPLLGQAFEIVMRQPRIAPQIFPYSAATFSTIFPRACQALGIVDLRFHDLRHEGISRLFEQGYRIEQVALVSGHRDWKMLRRYTQVRAKDLHRSPREVGEGA